MKQVFLLFITLTLFTANMSAQACMPDTTVISDTVLISPLPFDAENRPEAGITDTACINTPYEFVFSLRMPDTLVVATLPAPVDRVELSTVTGVTGLPEGISFACDPPNCVFEAGETGCLVLSGTATNTADIGENPLTFTGRAFFTNGLFLDISFPDESGQLPESFTGSYVLNLKEEGAENCFDATAVGTDDYISRNLSISNAPNPFSAFTHIRVTSDITETLEFTVMDFMGKQIHRQEVNILQGDNTLFFDGADLPQGIYVYSLSNEKGKISRKMIVSRN